jgi:hypothetical protein
MTHYSSSNEHDFKTINRRTLDSHKWFLYTFVTADIKHAAIIKAYQAELFKTNVQKFIKYILMAFFVYLLLPRLTNIGHIAFIAFMATLIHTYETHFVSAGCVYNKPANSATVHMRFTCPDIFYRNRHYIFSGTQTELQKAFQYMRDDIDDTKKDPYFGRGDHDDLLDMPLDTFCNSLCECTKRTASNENYNCSHWNLHSYESLKELKKQVAELEQLNSLPTYIGFENEIINL